MTSENELAQKAIGSLCPSATDDIVKLQGNSFSVKYTGKLKYYNGNIHRLNNNITIHLSRSWQDVDDDIKIGLMHILMIKMLKLKTKETDNTKLYNSFIKNISKATEKSKIDPLLKSYFDDVNNRYFFSLIEMPNLVSRKLANNKFGTYNYITDTITINSLLNDKPELLKYVLYHEILHKQLKFKNRGGKNFYHTKEFRLSEQKYPNSEVCEAELRKLARCYRMPRVRKIWKFW